jgi:hypothetical protein
MKGAHRPSSDDDGLNSLQRAIQNWKQGVFGVLFVMANHAPEHAVRSWVLLVVHLLQVQFSNPPETSWCTPTRQRLTLPGEGPACLSRHDPSNDIG